MKVLVFLVVLGFQDRACRPTRLCHSSDFGYFGFGYFGFGYFGFGYFGFGYFGFGHFGFGHLALLPKAACPEFIVQHKTSVQG